MSNFGGYHHLAKIPCKYCGREINVIKINMHYNACKERMKQIPISKITIEEAIKVNRYDELKEYIQRSVKND